MCEPANKTGKIYYIYLYSVKCAQLVEVQSSIERSCLASGKTFGCKSGWLMFLPINDGTASTGQMAMFIAQFNIFKWICFLTACNSYSK